MRKLQTLIKERKPYQIIEWKDTENTGAEGWIVIDRLVNNICGGGLFMHSKASLQEVQDLAQTMSMKNAIQDPIFGGGKGGIKFNHKDPRAEGVLRRFLIANKKTIETMWCTGADLNTNNEVIHNIIRTDLGLDSGFHCLGKMLEEKFGIENQAVSMLDRIATPANEYFRLAESATGFSIAECLKLLSKKQSPRIHIQGFGAVAKSLAYYIQKNKLGIIVAISDVNGFIYTENGIDIIEILDKNRTLTTSPGVSVTLADILDDTLKQKYSWTPRNTNENDEDYLQRFLSVIKSDIFCPCANRYTITDKVLNTLFETTFSNTKTIQPLIICGANNVFASKEVLRRIKNSHVLLVPEWLSNCGNALIFMESLKEQEYGESCINILFNNIEKRLKDILTEVSFLEVDKKRSLYDNCYAVVNKKLKAAIQEEEYLKMLSAA